jgi:hypothetical protein
MDMLSMSILILFLAMYLNKIWGVGQFSTGAR